MESIDLDMDEIFDSEPGQTNRAEDDVDDDLGRHTGLPDLDFDEDVMRPSQDDNQNEGDEVLSNLKSLAKGAAKKKVTRPQPKLDPQRLKTARGLPALPKLFKDVKFCGKGHEVEDLKLLMSHLEHWGHRLFPKMPFDDLIERLEKLGGKKEMQTCIKRIRLDMPVLDGDIVAENDGDEEENKKDDDDQHDDEDVAMEDVLNAEEAYEEMIRQEQESRRQLEDDDTSDRADPVDKDHSTGDDAAMEAETAEAEAAEKLKQQRERMEKNRLLALQKRADRLGVPVSTLLSQTNSSSQS